MSEQKPAQPCPACTFAATMTPMLVSDIPDPFGTAYIAGFAQSPIENPKHFCQRHMAEFSRGYVEELGKQEKKLAPKWTLRLTQKEVYEIGLQVSFSDTREQCYAVLGRYIGAENAAKLMNEHVHLEKVDTTPAPADRLVPYTKR